MPSTTQFNDTTWWYYMLQLIAVSSFNHLITVTMGSSHEGAEREVSDIKKIIIIINKVRFFLLPVSSLFWFSNLLLPDIQ
jgi:hypothetical protein